MSEVLKCMVCLVVCALASACMQTSSRQPNVLNLAKPMHVNALNHFAQDLDELGRQLGPYLVKCKLPGPDDDDPWACDCIFKPKPNVMPEPAMDCAENDCGPAGAAKEQQNAQLDQVIAVLRDAQERRQRGKKIVFDCKPAE